MVSSAAAIAAALRDASTTPVEFAHRIEKGGDAKSKAMVLPSQDFQRLCLEQLDLFRRIVHPDALLSVFGFVDSDHPLIIPFSTSVAAKIHEIGVVYN